MITPGEARRLNALDDADIMATEMIIDKKLREYDGDPLSVFPRELKLSGKALKEIMRRYRENGWDVAFSNDLRDGDTLIFSEKQRPRHGGRVSQKSLVQNPTEQSMRKAAGE